jgi:hypothetical protein
MEMCAMNEIRSDLVIRLDEEGSRFVFFLRSKAAGSADTNQQPSFSVEISFEDLRERGADGAEKLVGESVLGFFDTLTAGRLNLPKHYLDKSDDDGT